ncbi:MAG: TIGR03936 family radical SAM-associated protein, partial [Synechococcaceae cyanobacterium ELA445]
PTPLPPRAPASERLQRLRFAFAKTGDLALLSHLDAVRLLERALRRSGLPVSFTGGFHPLPRLQFALALPLGVEADGEWLDLEMAEAVAPEQVRDRLKAQLPSEFRLLSVLEVPLGGPSLSQELASARWTMELLPEPAAALAPGSWRQALEDLLQAPEWIWRDTDKKGRPRERDCRPYLLGLDLLAPVADAGAGGATLRFDAVIDPQGRSLRPEQLQQWFSQKLDQPLALGRLRRERLVLMAPKGSPLGAC